MLLADFDKLNSSVMEDRSIQTNTVTGLQRLGDSLASLKVDMMKDKEDGSMDSLKEKVTTLGIRQLTQEQEITRSQGRLNKLEQDVGRMSDDLEQVQRLESKTFGSGDSKLREDVNNIGETLTTTRNTLAEVLTKMDILESQRGSGKVMKNLEFL